MKLEDIGPEPPRPTDQDYVFLLEWDEHERRKHKKLLIAMRPAFVVLGGACVVLLYTDGRYSGAIGFGLIAVSFGMCFPFMWMNSRKLKQWRVTMEKIIAYEEWNESKRTIERRSGD